MTVQILVGTAPTVLSTLPEKSIQCCVTSPPYYGLRDYGLPPLAWDGEAGCEHEWADATYVRNNDQTAGPKQRTNKGAIGRDEPVNNAFCRLCGAWRGCLGLEPIPDLYVKHLVATFREVGRVLRLDGVLFIVIGDSYAGAGARHGGKGDEHGQMKRWATPTDVIGCPPGSLLLIPETLQLALRADGWTIRNNPVWAKVAPMPESVDGWRWEKCRVKVKHSDRAHNQFQQGAGTKQGPGVASRSQREAYFEEGQGATEWSDCPGCSKCSDTGGYVLRRGSWRHTRAHETVIMATRGMGYWADAQAVKEAANPEHFGRYKYDFWPEGTKESSGGGRPNGASNTGGYKQILTTRNPRSVLTPKPQAFSGAHFATFPPDLIRPLILATCPEKCCSMCGQGYVPVVERTGHENQREEAHVPRNEPTKTDSTGWAPLTKSAGLYRPSCFCNAPSVLGTVLDPFFGAGTTGLVASRLDRNCIGIELNPEYAEMAKSRIEQDSPLMNRVIIDGSTHCPPRGAPGGVPEV